MHFLTTLARLLGPGGLQAVLAENLLIKHQLLVLNRSRQRAPATLLKFQRALIQRKYRLLFSSRRRGKPGPLGPSTELIRAIVAIRQRNPRYGCPKIAFIVADTFGVPIDKDMVRRVLAKYYRPDPSLGGGPSWLTFLGHTKDSLWSVDLFRCESIRLKTHWVLVVMDQFTRRIIGFPVTAGDIDGSALCRMFNRAVSGIGIPRYLSSDNDPLFTFQR